MFRGPGFPRGERKDAPGMSGKRIAVALLLGCLVFEEALGGQGTGNLVFCKRRRGEAGTYVSTADGKDPKRIMFLCGPEISPRFSPDGKRVLFSCVKAGKASVWIADREGADRKEICEGDQAAWSPDGSKIFFRRAGQIVERAVGSGQERIASPPGWKSCAFPDCSPDGNSLLFLAEAQGRTKLFVTAPGGQGPRSVADLDVASPARWSPDGHRIAYSDGAHILVAGADGSWRYRLTTTGGLERHPAWSPDGTMLVYCHSPTASGGWVLCAAKADGTQTRVLPKEDDVVSFFGADWRAAGIRPAESAAGMRAAPRVRVWDVGGLLDRTAAPYDEFVKKREGWRPVSTAPAVEGGVVIENERALLMLASKVCTAILVSKPTDKQTQAVELVPVSEKGEEARNVRSVKLTRSDGEEAVVELSATTAGGELVRTSWRVCGSSPLVQVSPVENARCIRIRTPMRYAVITDRFADDLLLDPASYAGTRVSLPGAPIVLGLVGSGEAVLELACLSDSQTVDLLKDSGPGKHFLGAEVRLAKAGFVAGVLAAPRLWYEERLNAKYQRKRINLNWEMPNPGAWRLAVRVEGRVYSETFLEKESARFDGKKLFLTEQEEFAGLVDLALVYLYDRSPGTPLDRLTPVDLALDGMGMESLVRALDTDGLQSYRTAPRQTAWADVFSSLQSLQVLYERGVETEEKAFAGHLCDDVPAFFEGMEGRLDEFAAFTREAVRLADGSGKSTPEAQAFFAGLKPTLDKLENACKRRGKLAPAAEAATCAAQIKELTPKDVKDVPDKKKKFSELLGKVSQAARERADLIRVFRGLVRELADRAGMSCVEHSELRAPATRLRQLAQGVLRNRYYFEADWRGELHRTAPFWLGPRPY